MLGPIVALALAVQTTPAPARSLFIVTYSPGAAWEAGEPMAKQNLVGHLAHMKALLERGHVFAAGGFTDSGTPGGMVIMWAASLDEANALVAADPAVRDRVFAASVRAWAPRFDSKRTLTP